MDYSELRAGFETAFIDGSYTSNLAYKRRIYHQKWNYAVTPDTKGTGEQRCKGKDPYDKLSEFY